MINTFKPSNHSEACFDHTLNDLVDLRNELLREIWNLAENISEKL